jgi:hypothetical protein
MSYRVGLVFAAAGVLAASNLAQAGANLAVGVRVIAGAESATFRQNRLLGYRPLTSATVPAGAEVRCDKPCTLQVDADNTLVLSAGAAVSVANYFYVPLVANAPSLTPAHQIELRVGVIEAISPSARALALVISPGPDEHVALRDGRAQISQKGERTSVAALSGKVRVGGAHSWITLDKGQSASVRSKGRPSSPRAMADGPKWLGAEGGCPAGLSVIEQEGRGVVGGCWERGQAAAGYRVELAQDAEFRKPIASEMTQVSSWSTLLGVGRYFARVRSIDADGLWGQPSATRQLAVVPCVMPPGSMTNLETHTLVVPQGREIGFGESKDLELAIDQGGFSRAPKSIVMDEGPEHKLRFRLRDDPGSTSTVYIARRRALVANVLMTPKKANWPTDPVDIVVTIADPSGQVDPTKVEPRLQVLLGLTELRPSWSHHGAVWSTHLEPRSTGGPTVVRVIAQDEYGTPIGRNFLEIEEKQQQRLAIDTAGGTRVSRN